MDFISRYFALVQPETEPSISGCEEWVGSEQPDVRDTCLHENWELQVDDGEESTLNTNVSPVI